MKKPSSPQLIRIGSVGRTHYRHAETQRLANAISKRVYVCGLAVLVSSLVLYGLIANIHGVFHGISVVAKSALGAFFWLFVPGDGEEASRVAPNAPLVAMLVLMIFVAAQRIRLCLQAIDLVSPGETPEAMKLEDAMHLRKRWASLEAWESRAAVLCCLLAFGIALGNIQPWADHAPAEEREFLLSGLLWFLYFFGSLLLIGVLWGIVDKVALQMIPAEQRKTWTNSRELWIKDYFQNVLKHIEHSAADIRK